jgi:glycosyltransferase involved in cell wall biosynthesis
MNNFKVVHIPFNPKEPYTYLLIKSLKSFGTRVIPGRSLNFNWLSLTVLYNIFRHAPARILHIHWQHPFFISTNKIGGAVKSLLSMAQLYFAKLIGIKIVWTIHNLHNHQNCLVDLELRSSKYLAAISDTIIVHCNAAKYDAINALQIKYSKKISVLPQGNYKDYYCNTINRNHAREILELDHTDFIYLYFGTIWPYKGVTNLAKTFSAIDNDCTKLVIAGNPRDTKELSAINKVANEDDRINFFPSFISDNDLQTYLNAADVIVLPFREIFNSGSAVLAITFGKPVIAPRLGCLPELLESSGNILYEASQPDGLSIALKHACEMKESLHKIESCNLEASAIIDWKWIADETTKLYKALLGQS